MDSRILFAGIIEFGDPADLIFNFFSRYKLTRNKIFFELFQNLPPYVIYYQNFLLSCLYGIKSRLVVKCEIRVKWMVEIPILFYS
jgi:hypothetical protein